MISEILQSKQKIKNGVVFGQLSFDNHEQIVFCNDKDTGLKAIIGIHNTTLGPALGGTRMWTYDNEWQALNDVLRLSRGMTYKAAITGLKLGGGKAVIIGNTKKDKSIALLKRFGSFIHSLGGKYITAEDVGMETADMDVIKEVTPYVTGISKSKGGAGNPSPITAYGVYLGMKAAAKFKYGSDKLKGKHIVVEGVGHVGETLVKHLVNEDAKVTITDINQNRLDYVSKTYGVPIYQGQDIYLEPMDIYAPCALGATINDITINKFKATVIAGAANNQLANEKKHGALLKEKNIVYAPDFLINAGGIINVYAELKHYGNDDILNKTENIYYSTLKILKRAKQKDVTPNQAALDIAKSKIKSKKEEFTQKKN